MHAQGDKRKRIDAIGGSDEEYIERLELRVQWLESLLPQHLYSTRSAESHANRNHGAVPSSSKRLRLQQSAPTTFLIVDPTTLKADKLATNKPSREFWGRLPKCEKDWQNRRELAGLSTSDELVRTFCILTRIRLLSCPSTARHDRRDAGSIADVLRAYGSHVKTLETSKVHATQIWNFSAFLFICKTIVALELGVSVEVVDECTRDVLRTHQGKCTATAKQLKQLRRNVLRWVRWANDLCMQKGGLAHRAWELPLLFFPCIHTLQKLSHKGTVAICTPPAGELQAYIPFEIPFLVKLGFGPRSSLETINQALHTNLQETEFRARVEHLVARIDPIIEDLRARYTDLASSRGNCALDDIQRELCDLEIVFDDQGQEEVPEGETFVADQLWQGTITFTEQLYSSWSDMDAAV